MIRDIFNVCVALVLSARARQIFGRILWRHRTIIAMAAAAAVPVIMMLIPMDYHAPARHAALEITNNVVHGGDTTATPPVWSSGTSGTKWTTSANWTTSVPLNVANGGTGVNFYADSRMPEMEMDFLEVNTNGAAQR